MGNPMYYVSTTDFPAGFDAWSKGDREHPLMDDKGYVAMWYRGRYRIRDPFGFWKSLGRKSNYGRNYYFVELQKTNSDWLSDWMLDSLLDDRISAEEQAFVIMPLAEKTREVESLARRQQSQWANAIRARAGNRCWITGSVVSLEAAHLKPFCLCSPAEAVSLDNGVCLTASVHRLFDRISALDELPEGDPIIALIDRQKMDELIRRRDTLNQE
ncbi:HNH endonuclease [Salmonella enterica]|uniref:HNH endonuclease signature motif containing protein n=1 Tax=Salmonella enterica TaxID=28901 RepID=UPI00128506D3|nr:HNH endonuclease signature motif containing protein [Salmonella enterica]EBS0167733.1 HNH endonuclease [Salmonella enterica subsp. enterica serovar Typhimurium]ECJ5046321.1 HNH endonuclease [Salmonella enterica subsp. enterica]EIN6501832.1 HNH endonuclease [Salmonella enterica subsp. enterica serovar Newport]EAT4124879.1 HNH endonuclease [Salmonella enterica]EAZ0368431.1 HNH endonuclease [Salmonella enterica]